MFLPVVNINERIQNGNEPKKWSKITKINMYQSCPKWLLNKRKKHNKLFIRKSWDRETFYSLNTSFLLIVIIQQPYTSFSPNQNKNMQFEPNYNQMRMDNSNKIYLIKPDNQSSFYFAWRIFRYTIYFTFKK